MLSKINHFFKFILFVLIIRIDLEIKFHYFIFKNYVFYFSCLNQINPYMNKHNQFFHIIYDLLILNFCLKALFN